MSDLKKLVKDIFIYLPAKFIPALLTLLYLPVLTRYLSTADYGLYNIIFSTINVCTTLTVIWLRETVIRYYSLYESEGKLKVLYTNLLAVLIPSLFLGLVILSVANVFLGVSLQILIITGAYLFIKNINLQFYSLLRARKQSGRYSSFNIAVRIISTGLGMILLIFAGMALEGVFLAKLIATCFSFFILSRYLIQGITFDIKLVDWKIIKQFLMYGIPFGIMNASAFLLSSADRYIIKFFFTDVEVGLYSAAYSLSDTSVRVFLNIFIFALGPILFASFDKDGTDKSMKLLSQVVRIYIVVFMPVAFGFAAVGKQVLPIFTTADYLAGHKIIIWVSLGIFLHGLTMILSHIFSMLQDSATTMKNFIWAGIINVALNIIFIPLGGYYMAAITTLVSYLVLLVVTLKKCQQRIPIKLPKMVLLKTFFASGIMYVAVRYQETLVSGYGGLILMILSGIVIYFLVVFLFKVISREEVTFIKNMLDKVIKKVEK